MRSEKKNLKKIAFTEGLAEVSSDNELLVVVVVDEQREGHACGPRLLAAHSICVYEALSYYVYEALRYYYLCMRP